MHVASLFLIRSGSIKFPDKYHLALNTFVHGYVFIYHFIVDGHSQRRPQSATLLSGILPFGEFV